MNDMITQMQTQIKTETNIKLPLAFILFGLVSFALAQSLLWINTSALSSGVFRMPDLWMAAHFLLLGWAVMVVMGAMYQLVPVAFLTPIWNEKFGFLQFFITAIGVAGLSITLSVKPGVAIFAGVLTVIGILMFLFQIAMTLLKQEKVNVMTWFVGSALVFFLLTIVAGLTLTWNLAFGTISNYDAFFKSHLVFGLTGWFTLLIFGFSYKMVPMFSLSHGFSMKWAKPAFMMYISGLIVLIVAVWIGTVPLNIIGWGLLWLGFTGYALDMKEIITKRIKKKLDQPFIFSLAAIGFGWLLHTTALLLAVLQVNDAAIWSWLVYLYIMMWIVFSIMGYLYKIVPFLWWTHKYSGSVGKKDVPTLKAMIQEKWGTILFTAMTFGVMVLAVTSMMGLPVLAFTAQGILTAASALYVISIARVLTR
ncbi:membrane protein [Thalassobacillus devorans]|uniref:Membrane protein n=2 Tax=Thalassobacillus devorans TaxID=279813 RepID=A0ABQ1NEE2_9BACI|nr:membrane protein [Thalassobacillus devorans]